MHLIGAPGFGKHQEDYIEDGLVFCMGGPGILMSRGLLKKIRPTLHTCFDKLLTQHEDLEIGRCIWRLTGRGCTKATDIERVGSAKNFGEFLKGFLLYWIATKSVCHIETLSIIECIDL